MHSLVQDYELLDHDDELRFVKDAIRLSAHALSCDTRQLHSQLSARLVSGVSESVDAAVVSVFNPGPCTAAGPATFVTSALWRLSFKYSKGSFDVSHSNRNSTWYADMC